MARRAAGQLFDVVVVGAGPSGSALAATLGSKKTLAGLRVALVDPGKLNDTKHWEPPRDTYLARTLQITSSNKQYLKLHGLWDYCFLDRVQAYNQAIVTDAAGQGMVNLELPQSENNNVAAAFMIETKNLIRGMLRSIDDKMNQDDGHAEVDVFEKAKVVGISRCGASNWPVVSLSNQQKLRARLIVGADGINSVVRKNAQIGVYGSEYNQYALTATVCLEKLNETAFQRFLPTGPIALLPFPGGFANLVWSLSAEYIQLLKTAPESVFASLINAAFRLSPKEMQCLYEMLKDGIAGDTIQKEIDWRLSVFATSNNSISHGTPPSQRHPPVAAAVSPKSRVSFPLRMRTVDRLVSERVVLIGDAGHVVHPLAGQGLNMGLEDVQCLARVLEQAMASGEDLGTLAVLERYNRERYIRSLALQGIVDKVWHVFSASSASVVGARSLLMNGLDRLPLLKQQLVKSMMA